jgi:hypothetical protein
MARGANATFLSCHHFDGDASFVRGFMRQHRLADHVADREDRRFVSAPLLVHHDEAALIDLHLGPLESGDLRVRPAPHRHQDAIEDLLGRVVFALERHPNALRLGRHLHDFRFEQHAFHGLHDALRENVNQIAIGTRQQTRCHFDDCNGAVQSGVDSPELQTDVATADDQQRFRNVRQVERTG